MKLLRHIRYIACSKVTLVIRGYERAITNRKEAAVKLRKELAFASLLFIDKFS